MRKITLFIASLFITIGAMAQTFVMPETGKYYKIKGENSSHPWLTNEIVSSESNALKVSNNENDAAIFLKTENGLKEISTKKYLYYSNDGEVTLGASESPVYIGENHTETANGKMYSIRVGNYNADRGVLHNNDSDATPTTHTGSYTASTQNDWGFIEVNKDYNNTVLILESWRAPIYYDAEKNKICANTTGSDDSQRGYDVNDDNQHFLLLRTENTSTDKYYLYSVAAGKFVGDDNTMLDKPTSANISFEATSVTGADGYNLTIYLGGKKINTNTSAINGIVLPEAASADKGNCFKLIEVGTPDANTLTSAMSMIHLLEEGGMEPNEITAGYYRIYSKWEAGFLCQKGTTDLYHDENGASFISTIWEFVESGTEGQYKFRNAQTGQFINSNTKLVDGIDNGASFEITYTTGTTTQTEAPYIKINGTDNCLHSNQNEGKVKAHGGDGEGNRYYIIPCSGFSHTLSVGNAGWATLVLGFNAEIPEDENFKAYTVNKVTKDYVSLSEVTGVLGANTPIIINAPEGNYEFRHTAENATVTGDNKLRGTLYNKVISESAYVLGNGDNGIGLYKATTTGQAEGTFINNANKAYLPVPATASLSNSLRFDFGSTTAIEEVEAENENADVIYDLQGRRVNEITEAGIYIVNGNKVLVK